MAVVVLTNDITELAVEVMTVVVEDEVTVHVAVAVTREVAADEDTATILTLEVCSAQE